MIEVDRLTKRYGDVAAVDAVTFKVEAGEILGFLGLNGAGKTTTMRMLTCFIPPSSGTARLDGRDIWDDPVGVRRLVGYLPESVPLYPEMRVEDYLHFRARLKGLARADRKRRVGEVVARCGLDGVRRRTVGHLSKGYRQRVGLAEALVHDPPILILDEPTVGLDPGQIREVRRLIKELGEKRTVILSTHILPEVELVCTRVAIINKGRIVASDSLDKIRAGMQDSGRVTIEVDGPFEEVRGALAGVADLAEANEAPPFHRFVLRPANGADPRADLARLVVGRGWGLRELRRDARTLEDVFIETTVKAEERPFVTAAASPAAADGAARETAHE